ncbi:hypothetical protein IWW50_005882 [Coemansia erecta]|nr:hypothetical protein GGF43_001347 [Coemansia sp. RSA 2618]KAJ2818240.1 hypothetical protein IWW50_005882 [Coemansia erecta]
MKLFSYGCVAATAMLLSAAPSASAQPVRLERRDPLTRVIHHVVHVIHPDSPSTPQPSYEAVEKPQPAYAAASTAPTTDAESERKVLCLVNKERRRVGLNALKIHPAMTKAAYDHSVYQSSIGTMTHKDPSFGPLGSRLKGLSFQFATAAENIAEAPLATAEDVFNMWMGDEGHYANIVSPQSTYMGLACVKGFWTQDFGSSMDASPPAYEAQHEADDVC